MVFALTHLTLGFYIYQEKDYWELRRTIDYWLSNSQLIRVYSIQLNATGKDIEEGIIRMVRYNPSEKQEKSVCSFLSQFAAQKHFASLPFSSAYVFCLPLVTHLPPLSLFLLLFLEQNFVWDF